MVVDGSGSADEAGSPWTVVVPLARRAAAKSRLGGDPDLRGALAAELAESVIRAATGSAAVARVVVCTPEPRDWSHLVRVGAEVIEGAEASGEPTRGASAGLNSDLSSAASALGAYPLAVIVGDLPLLSATALELVLRAASEAHEARSFVADRHGTGTTMSFHRHAPAGFWFGPGSASAHRAAGFAELTAPLAARVDLDTAADLAALSSNASSADELPDGLRGALDGLLGLDPPDVPGPPHAGRPAP